jgi:hypothetical protein
VDRKPLDPKPEEKPANVLRVSKYAENSHNLIVKQVLKDNLDRLRMMMLAFSTLQHQVWD